MKKLTTIVAGAGLALATLAGALVGTADAATPPGGGTHGGPGDTANRGRTTPPAAPTSTRSPTPSRSTTAASPWSCAHRPACS